MGELPRYPERTYATPLESGAEFDLHRSDLPQLGGDIAREALSAALPIDRQRDLLTHTDTGELIAYDVSRLAWNPNKPEQQPTHYDWALGVGARILYYRNAKKLENPADAAA